MEESSKRKRGSNAMVLVRMLILLMLMTTMASAFRITVGGNKGWSPNVNYTAWIQSTHFYYDDWLYFVYDRNQQSVLEVNEANCESCNSDQPLHIYTTGSGRDVVHLNASRSYYFISRKRFCLTGMKLAIHLDILSPPAAASAPSPPPQELPPPASSPENPLPRATQPSPTANNAPASLWTFKCQLVVPVALAAAGLWSTNS